MATYSEAEDMINIGAYKRGSNPGIDNAIDKIDAVNQFLQQPTHQPWTFEETMEKLYRIFPQDEQPETVGMEGHELPDERAERERQERLAAQAIT